MKQLEIINKLKIHIPIVVNNHITIRKRITRGEYCYNAENIFKKGCNCLIENLNSLVNENYIDLNTLKEYGFNGCVKQEMYPKHTCHAFQNNIMNKFSVKEKVIDNMLYAILLIDYSLNFKDS